MNYSFEYIDIILLAMIAGFIFLRLRGILGKRTGFDGKTPAQFKEVLKNIKVEQNGEFIFPVTKGKWKLLIKSKSIKWKQRKIINVEHAPIELMNIFAGSN